MKLIGKIILILAAALVVVGATVALANTGLLPSGGRGEFREGRPERTLAVGEEPVDFERGERSEFGRGEGREGGFGFGWLSWVKNLGLIGLIVAGVALVDRLRTRRPKPTAPQA